MSTSPPPGAVTTNPAPSTPVQGPKREVTVISHSQLFYWWPVWAVGYLMAIITMIDGHLMAVLPKDTKALIEAKVTAGTDSKGEGLKDAAEGEVYFMPTNTKKPPIPRIATGKGDKSEKLLPQNPRLHMAASKNLGVVFCIVLLLVVLITNVPLRGMWSLVVIIVIVMLSVIFALADLWERIFEILSVLDIRINMGGYLFIATGVLILWAVTFFFFDRQVYMVFSPGQFKVCTEIGGGEKVYDTMGLTLERQRGDLFRHYILGLGSGDLVVRTTGAQAHQFDMPNVLFISKKVKEIEDLLKTTKTTEVR